MKKLLIIPLLYLQIGLFSCEPTRVDARYVIRDRPVQPVYTRPYSPGPGYIWIDGDWRWEGNNYRWHEGYWGRPHANRHWEGGRWENYGDGYRWHNGRWQR